MGWIDAATNPQGIMEIFGDDTPPLVGVSLHEVIVGRDGPTLRLRLDLPTYPASPPVKWKRGGFNTVQVELLFGGLTELSLRGVSTHMLVDVDIEANRGIILQVKSEMVNVAAVAASVTISRMEAYLDSERESVSVEDVRDKP
ncbi:Imm50 family immunity protein [Micromonospora taraxaci]|uniref:Imm50 family immunity protein n=1 Tax=Micromonospora taraxaci TaxID=1316803 RepID=UPI0033B7D661